MAAPGPVSHASPADTPATTAQAGSAASVGLAARAGAGEEPVSLWPFVGLAFIALVLAVLWRKNGGLRFFAKRPGAPPSGRPVLQRPQRNLPDRRG